MPNEHHHRLSRIAVLDSAILAIACLITFMLAWLGLRVTGQQAGAST